MSNEDKIKDLMDDDDIRNYFKSRDPERKKPSPGLTEEAADSVRGKASTLTPKEEKEEIHGVSFTQYVKGIRDTRRHSVWIGLSIGLFLAIIITLLTS